MTLLLLSARLQSQDLVEKRLDSQLQMIIVEFGQIDHLELISTASNSEIVVRAEGNGYMPNFEISETTAMVLIKDYAFQEEASVLDEDKVCSRNPDFTSYKIYVPEDKELHVSVADGNCYAKSFDGSLQLKIGNGLADLTGIHQDVSIYVNSGKVYVHDIQNVKLDVKTNLGVLRSELGADVHQNDQKKLAGSRGEPRNSLYIRTILANIFLYGSEG